MGFLAKDFSVEAYDLVVPEAYSKITHLELDIPTGYCRIDLAWYVSKEAAAERKQALGTWSFVLDVGEITNLLKNAGNETALELAYNTIKGKDERFQGITDDK